ncbi:unnamed protein product [Tuber aestivum]|uniref:Guanine nucleotide-binding protein subunit gamma n=1 Tax=Tuber aestivum TaxID=59557 RepID=A0A292PNV2_9PEZI|nr:unnamed protein product [Tuber aestivum]
MAIHSTGAVREKKQTMAELKLRRLTELNARLREDLDRPRVKVSEACHSMIAHTRNTKDFMVPSTWGQVSFRPFPSALVHHGYLHTGIRVIQMQLLHSSFSPLVDSNTTCIHY